MDGLVVVPRAEELQARLADHAVAQRPGGRPCDGQLRRVEEPELGRWAAERLLDHLHRVRTLHLEAVRPAAPVRAQCGPQVEVDRDVVSAGLGVVDDPVERRSPADEVEAVVAEREEDDVADDVSVRAAGHEVLGAISDVPAKLFTARCERSFRASGPSTMRSFMWND